MNCTKYALFALLWFSQIGLAATTISPASAYFDVTNRIQTFSISPDPNATSYNGAFLELGQAFQITSNSCSNPPAPCSITVEFTATAVGSYIDSLTVYYSDNQSNYYDQTASLNAYITSNPAQLSISPKPWDFQQVAVGQSVQNTFRVDNLGDNSADISGVNIASPFAVASTDCIGILDPKNFCNITVSFSPTQVGQFNDTLFVSAIDQSSGADASAAASISGQGIAPPSAQLQFNPTQIDFGGIAVGQSQQAQVQINNIGGGPAVMNSFNTSPPYSVQSNCPSLLDEGQSCSATVIFQPMTAGDFASQLVIDAEDHFSANPIGTSIPLFGQGIAGQLSANPTQINFGTVLIGQSSNQNLTLNNPGNGEIVITNISTALPFSHDGACMQQTIQPGGSCQTQISFQPSQIGNFNQNLIINAVDINGQNLSASVSLSGIGDQLRGELNVNPINLNFGTVPVGQQVSQSLTLSNSGQGSIRITALDTALPFSHDGACLNQIIAPGGRCQTQIYFQPDQHGSYSQSLNISAQDLNTGEQYRTSVGLQGFGEAQGNLVVSPTSLNFGTIPVGEQVSQNLVLINSGNGDIRITVLDTVLPFSHDGACLNRIIAPGARCQTQIYFQPDQHGSYSQSLKINAKDLNTGDQYNAVVNLQGQGLQQGDLAVDPINMDFGTVKVGEQAIQSLTLSNTGNGDIRITALDTALPFSHDGACLNQIIAAGGSCQTQIRFQPDQHGSFSQTLSINAEDLNTGDQYNAVVGLQGQGLQQGDLAVDPINIDFGTVKVGEQASQILTLSNTGQGEIHITALDTALPFSHDGACLNQIIAAGAQCQTQIQFKPDDHASYAQSLSIHAVDLNSGQNLEALVGLTGQGLKQGELVLDQSQINFGSVLVGQNRSMPLTLTNPGNGDIRITALDTALPFSHDGACLNQIIAAGGSCQTQIRFQPDQAGNFDQSLQISALDLNTQQSLSAVAQLKGQALAQGELIADPVLIDYGEVMVGEQSSRILSLKNNGGGDIQIQSINLNVPFSHDSACLNQVIAPGDQCQTQIIFKPSAAGDFSTTLAVQALDINSGQMLSAGVSLYGYGKKQALLVVSPLQLDFGALPLHQSSPMQSVSISNQGNAALNLQSIEVNNINFSLQNQCPSQLSAGQSCQIQLQFQPQSIGLIEGKLQINAQDEAGYSFSEQVKLYGQGLAFGLKISGTTTFSGVLPGDRSAPQSIQISNQSSFAVLLQSITIEGKGFELQRNECPTRLAASQDCQVELIFAPTESGQYIAKLVVQFTDEQRQYIMTESLDLSGQTLSADEAKAILDQEEYTQNNPQIESVVDVISEICTSGQATPRLQQDCNDLMNAAEAGDPGVAQALQEITPERATKASRLSRQSGEVQIRNIGSRLRELRNGRTGFSAQGLSFNIDHQIITGVQIASLSDPDLSQELDSLFGSRWGGFITGTLVFGDKDQQGEDSGYDFDTQGITLGLDYRLNERWIIGLALGYINTDVDLDYRGGTVDDTGYTLSLYGTYYDPRNYFLDFAIGYGWHSFDQKRHIRYVLETQGVEVDQTAIADYDGNMFNLSLNAGYDFNYQAWNFGPRIGLDYIRSDVDSFREKMSNAPEDGGGWSALIKGTDQEWLTLRIGGQASYALSTSWGVVTPYAGLDWLHEFKDDSQLISGAFIQDPESPYFDLRNSDPDRNYFRGSLGASAVFKNGITGYLDYDALFSNDQWNSQSINLGIRIEF